MCQLAPTSGKGDECPSKERRQSEGCMAIYPHACDLECITSHCICICVCRSEELQSDRCGDNIGTEREVSVGVVQRSYNFGERTIDLWVRGCKEGEQCER